MNPREKFSSKSFSRAKFGSSPQGAANLVLLFSMVLLCGLGTLAQPQQPPDTPGTSVAAGGPAPDQPLAGSIRGVVVDQTGAVVAGARVTLTREGASSEQEVQSDNDGQFVFAGIGPGPFEITVTATNLATRSVSGTLDAGQVYTVPQISLAVAAAVTEVRVTPSQSEIAEEQIKQQEKQRVLGFVPNFYVSYIADAAPLTAKQKFKLAWKSTVDPVTFLVVGGAAGLEQAQDQFSGYGQGAAGYGRRYGAAFGDLVSDTFIGSALLPSLLKQDPRYFYKGTGSTRSRVLYAIVNSVICKGDDRRWQANYSAILGSVASGGISNLYYPSESRGAGLVFKNALIGIGESAAANLVQEFVIRKLTPNLAGRQASKS